MAETLNEYLHELSSTIVNNLNSYGVNAKVSTSNTTSTLLAGDAVYTGAWEDVSQYATLSVIYESDVDSISNGLEMQFSVDGVSEIRTKKITPQLQQDGSGNYGGVHELACVANYFRVKYTNGTSAQSSFNIQTIYSKVRNKHLTSSLNQTLSDADDVELVKNTTLGGSPSYTDISTNTSIVDYDTAGTTLTGGQVLDISALSKDGSEKVEPKVFDIFLDPGDTLTLAAKATSSTTDVTVSVRWVEDF